MLAPDIVTAARRIVAAEGAEALTVARLARETGRSRATLYRQGASREALLDALEAGGEDVGDRSDARARILAAAPTVFARAGIEAATIEQVAEAAEVGVATVYRHFGDRDGLVAAVLDEIAPRRAMREARAAFTGDLAHDLRGVAVRVLTGMRDEAAVVRLVLMEALRDGPALARARAATQGRSVAAIATLLREHVDAGTLRDVDPAALAQAFAGMLFAFGVLAPVLHGGVPDDPEDTARLLTDLFLRGAMTPAPRR